MKIFDYVDDAADGKPQLQGFDQLSLIWIHRIGPGIGMNAIEISKAFQDTNPGKAGSYTGGNMPYHLIGTRDNVQQALALAEKGAHARKFGNMWGIGFAQIGDFNREQPPTDMWERAVDACAMIVPWLSPHADTMLSYLPAELRFDVPVVGHGEVPGAYGTTSGKQQPDGPEACPGKHWDMNEFRQDVLRVVRDRQAQRMADAEVRFT